MLWTANGTKPQMQLKLFNMLHLKPWDFDKVKPNIVSSCPPPHLSTVTLKRIDLTGNKISEIEDGAFSKLTLLEDLNLSENRLVSLPMLPDKLIYFNANKNLLQTSGVKANAFKVPSHNFTCLTFKTNSETPSERGTKPNHSHKNTQKHCHKICSNKQYPKTKLTCAMIWICTRKWASCGTCCWLTTGWRPFRSSPTAFASFTYRFGPQLKRHTLKSCFQRLDSVNRHAKFILCNTDFKCFQCLKYVNILYARLIFASCISQ